MDAHLWHRHAREEPVPAPAVLSLRELRSLASSERERYVRHRRRWLLGLAIENGQTRAARSMLTQLVEGNEMLGHGAKNIVAVDAANAVGKSTLVRTWARGQYRDLVGEQLAEPGLPSWQMRPGALAHRIPVAWVNLPAAARIKDLNTQVLQFFGYPVDGTVRSLTMRIADAVDRHQLRILVVDDAHLLNTRVGEGRDVLDHLKHMNTELGERDATMVLVGANLSGGAIFADPQIAGRLRVVGLHPMGVDTEADRTAWQQMLYDLEQVVLPYLPAAKQGLFPARLAPHIWRLTQGYLGDVAQLVAGAAHRAALEDRWTITVRDLESAPVSARARAGAPSRGSSAASGLHLVGA